MSNAPERISLELRQGLSDDFWSECRDPRYAKSEPVAYVRADLSDALLREAMEALGMAVDDLDEWVACGDSLDQAGFNMDGTADCAERARATLAKLRAHLEGEKEWSPAATA